MVAGMLRGSSKGVPAISKADAFRRALVAPANPQKSWTGLRMAKPSGCDTLYVIDCRRELTVFR